MSSATHATLSDLREEVQRLQLQFLPLETRPFVCSGDPRRCQVFIVGEEPATTDPKFWEFWRDESGFDRFAWLKEYEHARDPGKEKHSRTRRAIDHCIKELRPYKVLETNVLDEANPAILNALLYKIRPAVVLTHGDDARNWWAKQSASGTTSQMTNIDLEKHLRFHKSYKDLKDKLEEAKRALGTLPRRAS